MGLRHKPNSISLTLSGNEITDATRTTGTEGDGLSVPAGIGVWEATTNLVTNGGFETNITGWSNPPAGSNTFVRSTDQAKFGSASGLCTWVDNTTLAAFAISLTAAEHVLSAWLYIPTSYGSDQVRFGDGGTFASATGTQSVNANMSLRDQWQRVSVDITPDAGDLDGFLILFDSSGNLSSGDTVFIDGVQVELQPVATPYVETDGGTAARSAARAQIPVAGLFTETQGWSAYRLRMGYANTSPPQASAQLEAWRDDGNNQIQTRHDGTSWRHQRVNSGVGDQAVIATSFSEGDFQTTVSTRTSAIIGLSVNGSVFTTAANTAIPSLSDTTLELGSTNNTNQLDSNFLWCAFGAGTLTDADAATIDAAGNDPGNAVSILLGLGPTADPRAFYNGVNSNVDSIVHSSYERRRIERLLA